MKKEFYVLKADDLGTYLMDGLAPVDLDEATKYQTWEEAEKALKEGMEEYEIVEPHAEIVKIPNVKELNYGEFFKSLRIKSGMTQKEVADKIDVHESTISDYERNVFFPKRDKLEQLAIVLEFEKLIGK